MTAGLVAGGFAAMVFALCFIVALLYMGSQISDKLSFIGSTLNSVAP